MGLLMAVLVVCTGTLLMIGLLSDEREASPEHFCPDSLLTDLVKDGRISKEDTKRMLQASMEHDQLNGAALDIDPLIPGHERLTMATGEADGLRESSVSMILVEFDNGERVPCRATLTVWRDA